MKTITVATPSASYEAIIGSGILIELGQRLKKLSAGKAAVITDSNVAPLYLAESKKSLIEAGIDCAPFVFPAGEESKTPKTYLEIINFLAENNFTRQDCLIALGGGVVGDVSGFAAATYLRGIKYIQVPTTLLSMVDSSVGGKTGVDLPQGKNLLGAFKQPALVLADVSLLKSLPEEEITGGLGEAIKTAVLAGGELWDLIEKGENPLEETFISLCIDYKRKIVEADETETGLRRLLNLGHTPAHAIEKLSNYKIPPRLGGLGGNFYNREGLVKIRFEGKNLR